MNLLEKFKEINKDRKNFYYGISSDPISNIDNSWRFIEEHFEGGAKGKVFDLNYINEFKKDGKHSHTVSMYYLGISMKEIIEKHLINFLKKIIPNFGSNFKYEFIYTWFLACLYHDTACVIENKNNKKNLENSNMCFEEVIQEYGINYDIYDHVWKGKHDPITYDKEIIKKYLYYCFDHRGRIDHGIVGGFIYYDRLVKNYDEKWEEYKQNPCKNKTFSKNYFKYKNKNWRIEHLDHFAYISNAIISHNIWYSDDKKLYSHYNLESLIEPNNNKISIERDPLLIFLALVDTIEPVKRFPMQNVRDIWESIEMDCSPKDNVIKFKVLNDIIDFSKWERSIKSLETWLSIEVESNFKTKSIKIKL